MQVDVAIFLGAKIKVKLWVIISPNARSAKSFGFDFGQNPPNAKSAKSFGVDFGQNLRSELERRMGKKGRKGEMNGNRINP